MCVCVCVPASRPRSSLRIPPVHCLSSGGFAKLLGLLRDAGMPAEEGPSRGPNGAKTSADLAPGSSGDVAAATTSALSASPPASPRTGSISPAPSAALSSPGTSSPNPTALPSPAVSFSLLDRTLEILVKIRMTFTQPFAKAFLGPRLYPAVISTIRACCVSGNSELRELTKVTSQPSLFTHLTRHLGISRPTT